MFEVLISRCGLFAAGVEVVADVDAPRSDPRGHRRTGAAIPLTFRQY
jgi:hypothetical protein